MGARCCDRWGEPFRGSGSGVGSCRTAFQAVRRRRTAWKAVLQRRTAWKAVPQEALLDTDLNGEDLVQGDLPLAQADADHDHVLLVVDADDAALLVEAGHADQVARPQAGAGVAQGGGLLGLAL